ncbi:HAMP domain-containing histidine kinase [Brachybacterium sp. EF45031]|uniref:sensor histidine kinase n=1 Tax=Brachybacterium sillae TaxID=2810536 RepID=UPI00217CF519|nr:HAMP domain-containing sensor histidine kinase [Brachybacterium sillae]MCS6711418.1 HAMP domain-containing histidine kinase [Brachybacterium sillae]
MPRLPLRTHQPVSLWTRVVTVISLLLLAGTLVTGGLSLFLLERTLLQTVDTQLDQGMQEMVALTEAELDGDTGQRLSQLSRAPVDFVVEFRGPDGTTIATFAPRRHGSRGDRAALPQLTQHAVAAQQGKPFTVLDASGNRWRAMSAPTREPVGGSVILALPLDAVDSTMHEMALIIVVVGSTVVLVGMAAGGWVAHRALAPLRDVENTASQIAAGDLSRRVPVSGASQEVDTLAITLNEMLVRIEQAFASQSESEAKATRSEARMRRFVGDASHELRTPLAAIRGFGELYRMGAMRTEEDVAQAMRRIEDEARRMGSLVENLLRLARLDENPEPDLAPVDLADAIFDAAQDLRALDPTRTVMVVGLTGTPLPVSPHVPVGVMGDEPALRQVILNLVGNANRHTPKGSPVELAVGHSREGTVLLEVRDHGKGIPPEQRDKVFERFYRTDESRQRTPEQGGGAGLGLSIAATIVDQHKGRITVHQTPGGGATFRVELQPAEIDPEDSVAPDQVRVLGQDDGPSIT